MHITDRNSGVIVTTGIVGAGLPIANGLAWASQLAQDGRVTVSYFGDGASNIGAFHEALNVAALWQLPVVFVCQNNRYSEHTRFEVATSVERVSDRALGSKIKGVTVDGNDPIAVWVAADAAIRRARDGDGPTLIEALTFRLMGHTLGDDDSYMPKSEKAGAIANDPMPKFRSYLISEQHATEAELAQMESSIAAEIDTAVEFALKSPYPQVAELSVDVYGANTELS